MICKNPYMAGNLPFGCGQCLPCRINRRRQWMWRQYLESLTHEENGFVTLTYADEHLPSGSTLVPAHVSGFLKRLRKRIEPARIRFFAVGEYGDGGTRGVNPHYHVSLFGLSGHTDLDPRGRPTHHGSSQLIWDCWGKGVATIYEFNETTAQYVAGYVVKKLTAKDNPLLEGRHPEFARMSNRPGIGAAAAEMIAKQLLSTANGWITGDVPHELTIGKRKIPLGRYLLRKLRENVGFTEEYTKGLRDQVSQEKSLELLALLQNSILDTPRQAYLASIQQRIRQTEARAAIYAKRNNL